MNEKTEELLKDLEDMEWNLYRNSVDRDEHSRRVSESAQRYMEKERALFKRAIDYIKEKEQPIKTTILDVSNMSPNQVDDVIDNLKKI